MIHLFFIYSSNFPTSICQFVREKNKDTWCPARTKVSTTNNATSHFYFWANTFPFLFLRRATKVQLCNGLEPSLFFPDFLRFLRCICLVEMFKPCSLRRHPRACSICSDPRAIPTSHVLRQVKSLTTHLLLPPLCKKQQQQVPRSNAPQHTSKRPCFFPTHSNDGRPGVPCRRRPPVAA